MKEIFTHPLFLVTFSLVLTVIIVAYVRKKRRTVLLYHDEFSIWKAKKFGRYEIKSFLTRGDFNTTFEAYDPDRNKIVALRIMTLEYSKRDQIVEQFNLKGELLKFLSERFPGGRFIGNIQANATNFNHEIRPYVVSDYLSGASLAEVLKVRRKLSPNDTYRLIKHLAESASLAHSEKIWIREFSPKNILLSFDESGKMLIVIANVGLPYKNLPNDYARNEKMLYYSPEDRRELDADERSDVYALAALAFRMLEGNEYQESDVQNFQGASVLLREALSEDPSLRPTTIERFLDKISQMATMDIPGLHDLQWSEAISRIVRSREGKRIQADLTSKSGGKIPYPIPLVPRPGPRQWKRLFDISREGAWAALVFWIGAKFEWLFEKPKRFLAAVGILLLGIGYWLYVISFGHSGDITIHINELSKKSSPVPHISVSIEAYNSKTNSPMNQMTFTNKRSDEEAEGSTTWKTFKDGTLPIHYRGRFEPEDVILRISPQVPIGDYLPDSSRTVRLNSETMHLHLSLRPLRKGSIVFTIDDRNNLTSLPGISPPTNVILDLRAVEAGGIPSKNAKFTLDNAVLPSIGEGHWQSSKQKSQLNGKKIITYQVPDSSRVSFQLVPEGGSPQLGFECKPTTITLLTSSTFEVNATLKRQTGLNRVTFTFILLDGQDHAVRGVTVKLNENILGVTSDEGIVQYTADDINDFWQRNPTIKFDLTPFDVSMGWSRDVQIQKTSYPQITFHIPEIIH